MTDQMTWWNAVVGWQTPDPLDHDLDAIDLILEHLEGYSPALSTHPVDGVVEARISLQAPTIDAAYKAAVDLVAGATAETPIAVEVLREDLFEGRLPYIQPMVTPRA